MNLPLSYSKYSTFCYCPVKYFFQYIKRVEIKTDIKYPLVLGQLTHLFVKLYNDELYSKVDILNLKDNLSELHNLIKLKYPSYYDNTFKINEMSLKDNINDVIDYIKNNMVVYFHAIKLFNVYTSSFYPKISEYSNNIKSEFEFNNIVKVTDNINVCLYGSIDIIFANIVDNIVKFLYISDIKTGKTLYDHYYEQLYFYIYNIMNYNENDNVKIINSNDDIDFISLIKNNLSFDDLYIILFSLKENKKSSKKFNDIKIKYEEYIFKLFKNIEENLYEIYINKDDINQDYLFNKHKKEFNLTEKVNCKSKDVDMICSYCDYKDICEYKIKNNG